MAAPSKVWMQAANPFIGLAAGAAAYPGSESAPCAFNWTNINTAIAAGADINWGVNGTERIGTSGTGNTSTGGLADMTGYLGGAAGSITSAAGGTRNKARILQWLNPTAVAARPSWVPMRLDGLVYDADAPVGGAWTLVGAFNGGYVWSRAYGPWKDSANANTNVSFVNVYRNVQYGDNATPYCLTPRTTHTLLASINEYSLSPNFSTAANTHTLYLWTPGNDTPNRPDNLLGGIALEVWSTRGSNLFFLNGARRLQIGTPGKPAFELRGGSMRFYNAGTANTGCRDIVVHDPVANEYELNVFCADGASLQQPSSYNGRIWLINPTSRAIRAGDHNPNEASLPQDTGNGHGLNVRGRTHSLFMAGGTMNGHRHAIIHLQKDNSMVAMGDLNRHMWPRGVHVFAARNRPLTFAHPTLEGYYRTESLSQYGGAELSGADVTGQSIQGQPQGTARVVGNKFSAFRKTIIRAAGKYGADGWFTLGPNGSRNSAEAHFVFAANVASLSGVQSSDGITGAAGQTVLLIAQTTQSQNGPWVMAAGAWTRPGWFTASFANSDACDVWVRNGTTYAKTAWRQTTTGAITLGTTNLVFSQLTVANGTYTPYMAGTSSTPRKLEITANVCDTPSNFPFYSYSPTGAYGPAPTQLDIMEWTNADLLVEHNTIIDLTNFNDRRATSTYPAVATAQACSAYGYNFYGVAAVLGTFRNNVWVVPDTAKVYGVSPDSKDGSVNFTLGAANSPPWGSATNNDAGVWLACLGISTGTFRPTSGSRLKGASSFTGQRLSRGKVVRNIPATVGALEAE